MSGDKIGSSKKLTTHQVLAIVGILFSGLGAGAYFLIQYAFDPINDKKDGAEDGVQPHPELPVQPPENWPGPNWPPGSGDPTWPETPPEWWPPFKPWPPVEADMAVNTTTMPASTSQESFFPFSEEEIVSAGADSLSSEGIIGLSVVGGLILLAAAYYLFHRNHQFSPSGTGCGFFSCFTWGRDEDAVSLAFNANDDGADANDQNKNKVQAS